MLSADYSVWIHNDDGRSDVAAHMGWAMSSSKMGHLLAGPSARAAIVSVPKHLHAKFFIILKISYFGTLYI